jgi:hypothetical protein
MAVQTSARLLHDLLALGEGLVREHIGMAPIFTKIPGKGLPSPHRLQVGGLFETRLSDNGARIGPCGGAWYGLAAAKACALLVNRAQIGIILQGKVFTSETWIGGLIVELDYTIERISSFLLALEDIDQQRRASSRQKRGNEGDE